MSNRLAPTSTPADVSAGAPPRRGLFDALARRAVIGRLAALEEGRLTIVDGTETRTFGRRSDAFPVDVVLRVLDPRFYGAIASRGTIGAGEAYMHGWWEASDLVATIRLFVRNRAALVGMEGGLARLAVPLAKAFHWTRGNTLAGSRRNIAAHYDLSNDFYALMLDETMTYSAAAFDDPARPLADAQRLKLDRICRQLDLRPGLRLVEVGTGWGALAIHAARHFGVHVTTTTISRAQHDVAAARIAEAGLGDRITLLQRDYRELDGTFDRLVSVEMIEAVGARYLDGFFARCSSLLARDGLALIQAITIADRHYDLARRSVDFIQRYIFPGCHIPSLGAMSASLARHTDLQVVHYADDAPSYAATLRAWRERFLANLPAVRALGFGTTFTRMWEFYLAYCEGGFTERQLGSVQMLLAKPANRRAPVLPALG